MFSSQKGIAQLVILLVVVIGVVLGVVLSQNTQIFKPKAFSEEEIKTELQSQGSITYIGDPSSDDSGLVRIFTEEGSSTPFQPRSSYDVPVTVWLEFAEPNWDGRNNASGEYTTEIRVSDVYNETDTNNWSDNCKGDSICRSYSAEPGPRVARQNIMLTEFRQTGRFRVDWTLTSQSGNKLCAQFKSNGASPRYSLRCVQIRSASFGSPAPSSTPSSPTTPQRVCAPPDQSLCINSNIVTPVFTINGVYSYYVRLQGIGFGEDKGKVRFLRQGTTEEIDISDLVLVSQYQDGWKNDTIEIYQTYFYNQPDYLYNDSKKRLRLTSGDKISICTTRNSCLADYILVGIP